MIDCYFMNIFWGGTAKCRSRKTTCDCNSAEIVLLVHFISMQLNFPVLLMCGTSDHWFYAQQNAGLAIFVVLGNRIFSEKMVSQNIFTTHSVYIDKTKEKLAIFSCNG